MVRTKCGVPFHLYSSLASVKRWYSLSRPGKDTYDACVLAPMGNPRQVDNSIYILSPEPVDSNLGFLLIPCLDVDKRCPGMHCRSYQIVYFLFDRAGLCGAAAHCSSSLKTN